MARSIFLALCGLVVASIAAQARDPAALAPLQPAKTPILQGPPAPYPLSYADELAERLGIEHGHMDVFSMAPRNEDGFVPTLKGGVDRDGPKIKLQWRILK